MRILTITFIFLLSLNANANEGMWLLNMIDRLNLEDNGLKLTPEQIYSINENSLKDAVVGLGSEGNPFRFMCSAEIVSDQGLVFTNHHCGYEYIQNHSSVDYNYLKNGFWANSLKEELSNPGATASIMVRMEDVSNFILKDVSDTLTEEERSTLIDSLSSYLVDSLEKIVDYEISVKEFYEGNQYFMFFYETYKDVRLVGAPPSGIGKYGGDTDNWMWPRHTGDFCVLRIYTDKEGKPAAYHDDNIPLKPKHYFPISTKGIEKEDFTMIMGFPGSTDRYLTAYEIEDIVNRSNIDRIKIREKKLQILDEFMLSDEALSISYASKRARVSNYWKYFQGQNKAVRQLDVIHNQEQFEKELIGWAVENDINYGFLNEIKTATINTISQNKAIDYYIESVFLGPDILYFAYQINSHLVKIENNADSAEYVAQQEIQLSLLVDRFFENYSTKVDKKLMQEMFSMLESNISKESLPEDFGKYGQKHNGDYTKRVDKLFKKTHLTSKEELSSNLKNKNYKAIQEDVIFKEMIELLTTYRSLYSEAKKQFIRLDSAKRVYLQVLRQYDSTLVSYPDANSTLRFTYGQVKPYFPKDAVFYNYITYADGILEKFDPSSYEFEAPKELIRLIEEQNFGDYALNGKLPVCFISTNDITGGNSGSPVLNANGELIGIAFDGNWEAMSGDISFEPEKQRTISVDIRYVLFVIDKFAGAQRLIDELTLVHE